VSNFEALLQPHRDLFDAERRHAGGSQLDRQWNAVETLADLRDGLRIGVGDGEEGHDETCGRGKAARTLYRPTSREADI
jgi:hypothetical protein